MPIIKSAIKRAKQAVVRRERNIATKKDIKGAVKAFLAKPTAKGLAEAQSEIDTAVKKNVLDKKTAARRKSALSKVAKEAGVKLEATKKPAAKTTAPAKKATPKADSKTTAKAPAKKTTTKTTAAKAPAKKPATKKA